MNSKHKKGTTEEGLRSEHREVSLENSICAAEASTNFENKWWLGEESERGTERGRSRNFP